MDLFSLRKFVCEIVGAGDSTLLVPERDEFRGMAPQTQGEDFRSHELLSAWQTIHFAWGSSGRSFSSIGWWMDTILPGGKIGNVASWVAESHDRCGGCSNHISVVQLTCTARRKDVTLRCYVVPPGIFPTRKSLRSNAFHQKVGFVKKIHANIVLILGLALGILNIAGKDKSPLLMVSNCESIAGKSEMPDKWLELVALQTQHSRGGSVVFTLYSACQE